MAKRRRYRKRIPGALGWTFIVLGGLVAGWFGLNVYLAAKATKLIALGKAKQLPPQQQAVFDSHIQSLLTLAKSPMTSSNTFAVAQAQQQLRQMMIPF